MTTSPPPDLLALSPAQVADLSSAAQEALAIRLRDAVLADVTAPTSPDARAALRALIAQLPDAPCAEVEGLYLAPWPSAHFTVIRFVAAERLPETVRDQFARPAPAAPELAAAFVDPVALSYRSFENILPLDRLFERQPLRLSCVDHQQVAPEDIHTLRLEGPPETLALLHRLDGLGLYTPPLNLDARGGRRMIFHAAALARSLEKALRQVLPLSLRRGLSHVNPVFRLNHIAPGEAGFAEHLDSPYRDPARKHLSRYTVLLYLTGGQGDQTPALQVGQHAFVGLEPLQVVLFHQHLSHHSAPFAEGPRIFLRTELVYTVPARDLRESVHTGALFAQACYLTGESLLAPALAAHTHALYDRAARAHWEGESPAADAEAPFLRKTYRDVSFLTNGYDYWFPRCPALPLQDCAALAVLDNLNVQIGGRPFRGLCTVEILQGHPDGAWVPAAIAAQPLPTASPFAAAEEERLLPPIEDAVEEMCCYEYRTPFDAAVCPEVIDVLRSARYAAWKALAGAPIWVMGQAILLRRENIRVEEGRIQVLSGTPLAPLNFASMDWQCWQHWDAEDFVAVDLEVEALAPLVPPILFTEAEGVAHLRLDFFRNRWMVAPHAAQVLVPRVRRVPRDGARALRAVRKGTPTP